MAKRPALYRGPREIHPFLETPSMKLAHAEPRRRGEIDIDYPPPPAAVFAKASPATGVSSCPANPWRSRGEVPELERSENEALGGDVSTIPPPHCLPARARPPPPPAAGDTST